MIETFQIQDIEREVKKPRGKFNKDLLLNTFFEHTELFSPAADNFIKNKKYCGEVYKSKKYNIFWGRERERCIEGFENPITKLWIPGKYYHFLNYKHMKIIAEGDKDKKSAKRITTFPRFWPIHYFFSRDYILAKEEGLNLAVLKPRDTGFSELLSSFGVHEYTFQTEDPVFYFVAIERYLNKDGVLSKAWQQLNFHNVSTERAFKHLRQYKDQDLHKIASKYDSSINDERRTGGEIQGAVVDHPRKLRGARGYVNFEEGGSFPNLVDAWMTAKDLAEQGGVKFAMMCVWGCVCKGTKVWTADGRYINVEDLELEDGIVGYDGKGSIAQSIIGINPPAQKPCYRIELETGLILECSNDHPVLWSNEKWRPHGKSKPRKVKFNKAENVLPGDHLMIADSVPIFGTKKMRDARLIGLLIGDGNYSKNASVSICGCDKEVLEFIQDNYLSKLKREKVNKSDKRMFRDFRLLGFGKYLEELGIRGQTKKDKRLPILMYEYDKESVCELLAGYFDADGSVRQDTIRGLSIVLTSIVPELLEEVKVLLIKLGIHCTIIKENPKGGFGDKKGERHTVWRLYINRHSSILNFQKNVKLLCKHKQDKIDSVLVSSKENRTIKDAVFMFDESTGKGAYFKGKKDLVGMCAYKVLSVEYIGYKDIYNLNANTTHTYLANNIITANTGGEQGPGIAGLEDIFTNPDRFDCLEFDNCWEEALVDRPHGFFFPSWANMTKYMDKWGNTDFAKAKEFRMKEREKLAKGSALLLDKRVAEQPFCIHPDTWVSHENLGLVRIKDVPEKFDNGIQDRYLLKTKKGRESISTNTHFYYNGLDYVRLMDMKPGDKISFLPVSFEGNKDYQKVNISTNIECFKTEIVIDEDWAKFIGLYMGDGSLYGNGSSHTLSMVFDLQDTESYEWTRKFMTEKFKTPTQRMSTKNCYELRVNSKYIGEIFKQLDLVKSANNSGKLTRNVHVPDYIMKSPKSVITNFLSGVFDADGCSYKGTKRITMYTKYNQFLLDLQILLSGFGINAKRKSQLKINGQGRKFRGQTLELDAYFVDIFMKEIRFISERKNQVIQNHISNSKPPKDFDYDEVESIEFHSTGQVYDLTTEKGYYSAAGLWVHNTPSEALMRLNNNPFPVGKLLKQLQIVDASPEIQGVLKNGEFEIDEGKVKFRLNPKLQVVNKYPHKTDAVLNGAVTIFESPLKDEFGKVPDNLYYIVADCFAVDTEQATDWNSLGTYAVYKRTNTLFPTEDDILVAWYAGRPPRVKDFHRNVFMAARFYNAIVQTEIKGGGNELLNYAKDKGFLEYCGDRPTVFNHDKEFKKTSGRQFFVRIEETNKPDLLTKLTDWLLKERALKINGDETQYVLNLDRIYDRALLEELIKYNPNGNFDRISCMLVLMMIIQEAELQEVKAQTKLNRDNIFNRPMHSDNPSNNQYKLTNREMQIDGKRNDIIW